VSQPTVVRELQAPTDSRPQGNESVQPARITGLNGKSYEQRAGQPTSDADLFAGEDWVQHEGPRFEQAVTSPKPARPRPEPTTLTLYTHKGEPVSYPKPTGKATFNSTPGAGISWANWSWNPVTGCLHGCNYCYARELATSERLKPSYPVGSAAASTRRALVPTRPSGSFHGPYSETPGLSTGKTGRRALQPAQRPLAALTSASTASRPFPAVTPP
jgi:hypothetical protein